MVTAPEMGVMAEAVMMAMVPTGTAPEAVTVSVVVVMAPMTVMVMMPGTVAVAVTLRECRTGQQHESGGDETCETCLHGNTLSVRDEGSLTSRR
jgi:hypothetical protein